MGPHGHFPKGGPQWGSTKAGTPMGVPQWQFPNGCHARCFPQWVPQTGTPSGIPEVGSRKWVPPKWFHEGFPHVGPASGSPKGVPLMVPPMDSPKCFYEGGSLNVFHDGGEHTA
jgi:hypothetical protein